MMTTQIKSIKDLKKDLENKNPQTTKLNSDK